MKKIPIIEEIIQEEWQTIKDLRKINKSDSDDDLAQCLNYIIKGFAFETLAWLHNSTFHIQDKLPFLFLCTDLKKLTSNYGTQQGSSEMLLMARRIAKHPNDNISNIFTDNRVLTCKVKYKENIERA